MKLVTFSRAILTCAALAFTSIGFAQDEKEKDKKEDKKEQKLSAMDEAWVQMAALENLVEIRLAKLAQDKASSEQVKQHAAQMLKDHTTASDELKKLAKQKGIDLKQEVPAAKKEFIEEITSKSGNEFDQAYMAHEIAAHRLAETHFQNGADFLKDQELQAFAQKQLPLLQQHRSSAEKQAGSLTQTQQPQQPAAGTAGAQPQQQQQPGQVSPAQPQQQQPQPGQVETQE